MSTQSVIEALAPAAPARAIVQRTCGSTHGPITRLMSPGDLGWALRPFIFLDLMNFEVPQATRGFCMNPHPGIATLPSMAHGDLRYPDSTGEACVLPEGGVEWIQVGRGVWQTEEPVGGRSSQGFQLWVAPPAGLS